MNNPSEAPKERAFREWMIVAVGLTALLSVMATIVAVVGLASTSGTTTVTQAAAAAPASAATRIAAPVSKVVPMTISVKADDEHGRMGPDHQWHDAFLPADFAIHAGDTLKVTLLNYDGGPHTFTSPALGINQLIPGGGTSSTPVKVTFTIKAPAQAGKYQWWCAVPCDPWAMSHDGYMRGVVTVTV